MFPNSTLICPLIYIYIILPEILTLYIIS